MFYYLCYLNYFPIVIVIEPENTIINNGGRQTFALQMSYGSPRMGQPQSHLHH